MDAPDWSTWLMIGAGAFFAFNVYRSTRGKASSAEVKKLLEAGALLVDVRSAAEFSSGHLPGAKNIPVQELAARTGELGEKDAPIVVYCRSGARSGSAASYLQKQGFTRVSDLGAMSRFQ